VRRLAGTLLATIPLALLLMASPAVGSVSRDPPVPAPGIAAPAAAPDPVSPPAPAAPTPAGAVSTIEEVAGSLPSAQSLLGRLGLFGVAVSPATLSPGASAATPPAASRPGAAASGGAGAETSSATRRALRARRVSAVTGTAALLRVARSSAPLIALLVAAFVFLLVQGRLDRRAPQLVSAPLDRRQELLEFS